ncbi:MAG TPA: TetR/AcrR family transcriptional regulator [Alphaproteobacteria bacterium]|nr:TetR/AcrR family transcriptional regulator [Alphaproteobacteria bacterium]
MPWEKQFDPDSALLKAMQTFWARGYDATSMQDLVEGMGVNRGSLYATFGDKRSLFIQALKRYDAVHRQAWTAALAERSAPREAILGAFEGAIAAAIEGGSRDGCLLVNTALELSPHDPEVASIVAEALTGMERFFHTMIVAGQETGAIPARIDADATASALLGLFIGLRVLSRSRPEAPLLRAVADQAAAMLK